MSKSADKDFERFNAEVEKFNAEVDQFNALVEEHSAQRDTPPPSKLRIAASAVSGLAAGVAMASLGTLFTWGWVRHEPEVVICSGLCIAAVMVLFWTEKV